MGNARTELEEFASSQWGMFTTAQAQQLGIRRNQISRLVNQRRVEPMVYSVYRYTAGEETAFPFIKAAWLSTNPSRRVQDRLSEYPYDAVIADRTAAVMLGAGDFYASPYTFAVDQRRQTSRDDIRYLMRPVEEQDIVFIESLPVTSFERTIYDLVRSHEDPSLVDSFIFEASMRANHYFDSDRLAELLAPLAARNGYKKDDGKSFATDLLIKNSATTYVNDSRRGFERFIALINDSMRSSGEFQSWAASIPKIDTGVFDSVSQAFSHIQPGLIQTTSKLVQSAIPKGFAKNITEIAKQTMTHTTIPKLDKGVIDAQIAASKQINALKQ